GPHGDPLYALRRSHAAALSEGPAEARAAALGAALALAEQSPYVLPSLWIRLDLGLALAEAGAQPAVGELELVAALAHDRGRTIAAAGGDREAGAAGSDQRRGRSRRSVGGACRRGLGVRPQPVCGRGRRRRGKPDAGRTHPPSAP